MWRIVTGNSKERLIIVTRANILHNFTRYKALVRIIGIALKNIRLMCLTRHSGIFRLIVAVSRRRQRSSYFLHLSRCHHLYPFCVGIIIAAGFIGENKCIKSVCRRRIFVVTLSVRVKMQLTDLCRIVSVRL